MQYTVEVQKGTKQNLVFESNVLPKEIPKIQKKLIKSQKSKKKIFLYLFL
jgi:hypothetical protein